MKIIKQNMYLNISSTNQVINILIEQPLLNSKYKMNHNPNLIENITYRRWVLNKKLCFKNNAKYAAFCESNIGLRHDDLYVVD